MLIVMLSWQPLRITSLLHLTFPGMLEASFEIPNLTSSLPATKQPYSKVRLTAAPPRCPGNEASGKLSEKRVR